MKYGTLQFDKFEEIQKKGYSAAVEFLGKLDADGRLPLTFMSYPSLSHI